MILHFENAQALAAEAAKRFVAAIPPRAPFHVALSGGRISKAFYEAVVQQVRSTRQNVDHIHFFFADERCVPASDPDSNFLTARQFLFDPLQVRAEQTHRIHGEVDEVFAAQEAEAELCRIAPLDSSGQPILDLVILGLGEDGHTASLFPEEDIDLLADARVYRSVVAVKPPPKRITLGYAPLRAARELWTLASGPGKESALRQVKAEVSSGKPLLPLSRALLNSSKFLIFSDIQL